MEKKKNGGLRAKTGSEMEEEREGNCFLNSFDDVGPPKR